MLQDRVQNWGRCAALALAVFGGLCLAGCTTDGGPTLAGAAPKGSIAFESIDGPPQGVFQKLVQNLNTEAQTRNIAVTSRENASAYRVRGYLAAHVVRGKTSIAWVWDVYDAEQRRALRIAGEEPVAGKPADAWTGADDEILRRIARTSMDRIVAFLAAPDSGDEPVVGQAGTSTGVAAAPASGLTALAAANN